jgi:hypothetical protein
MPYLAPLHAPACIFLQDARASCAHEFCTGLNSPLGWGILIPHVLRYSTDVNLWCFGCLCLGITGPLPLREKIVDEVAADIVICIFILVSTLCLKNSSQIHCIKNVALVCT